MSERQFGFWQGVAFTLAALVFVSMFVAMMDDVTRLKRAMRPRVIAGLDFGTPPTAHTTTPPGEAPAASVEPEGLGA